MSSSDVIRVMVVDDHPIMRKGLRDVLEETGEFEIVGQAEDGVKAVEMAQELFPDVILMDVIMPKKSGVDACREIQELLPDTRVLMLTASTEEDAVIDAVAAGAVGYVQKFTDSNELLLAVREVAQGNLIIPNVALKRAFNLIRRGPVRTPDQTVLTKSERETLTLFARGNSYGEVAEARSVSITTVRNAIYRIQDKLGVNTKQGIVVWAVRNGLLDGDLE